MEQEWKRELVVQIHCTIYSLQQENVLFLKYSSHCYASMTSDLELPKILSHYKRVQIFSNSALYWHHRHYSKLAALGEYIELAHSHKIIILEPRSTLASNKYG